MAADVEKSLEQALTLVNLGKPAEAEQILAQACEQGGDKGKAWYLRGVIRLERGDREGALEYLGAAVARDPKLAEAHFALCQLHYSRGKLAPAIAAANRVVELDAGHGRAWLALGSLCADAGRYGEAERASRVALDLLPDAAEAKINLVNLLISRGNRDEAMALCNRLIIEPANHSGIWHSLGLAFRALGKLQDAERCLIRVTTADPRNAAALCALGELKAASNNASQALALYKKAKKINPADPRLHFQLGKVLLPTSSAKHRQLLAQMLQDHQYADTNEAINIARQLAAGFRYGDAGVERALLRFFEDYDPARVYPADWWNQALGQFGDRRQAADTALRSIYSTVFSWSLPAAEALAAIAAFAGKRIASYGSGAGYWEYLLNRHYGLSLACHDLALHHRFTPMTKTPHAEAGIDPEESIMLAWLPAEKSVDAGIELLLDQLEPAQKLVLIGEPADEYGHPRSCASHRFFRYLRENFVTRETIPLPNYAYFQDRVDLLVKI